MSQTDMTLLPGLVQAQTAPGGVGVGKGKDRPSAAGPQLTGRSACVLAGAGPPRSSRPRACSLRCPRRPGRGHAGRAGPADLPGALIGLLEITRSLSFLSLSL